MVRTLIESQTLETISQVEQQPQRSDVPETDPEVPSESPPTLQHPESSLSWDLELAYGLRWVPQPGPTHHSVAIGTSISGLAQWLSIRFGGRFSPPVGVPEPQSGQIWHAGLNVVFGINRQISVIRLGALLGADVEWLWGNVELDGDRPSQDFEHVGFGIVFRTFLKVRLYRGLELLAAFETVVRPLKQTYQMRGEPIFRTGHTEIDIEIGLGWQFE